MPTLFRQFRFSGDRDRWTKLALWLGIPTLLLLPSGIGFWAVGQLSGLPDAPQCLTVSWSEDNASTRLYCAKVAADRRTSKDFQQAIQLVSRVPSDHPLRPEADRLIQRWTTDILNLGEAAYQAGDLEQAIELAETIPQTVRTRTLADDRRQQWQDTWRQAEDLYEDAQAKLGDRDWLGAMSAARRLLPLENRYWATTKHQELMRQLQAAKEADQKVAQSKPQKPASSPVQDFLTKMRQEQTGDAQAHLSKARSLASSGKISDLQTAIDEAQQVIFGTDGYDEAQQLVSRWRDQVEQIEDRPHLDRALALASQDSETALQAAIAEANEIGWGRALYDEASSRSDQWRDRLFELQAAARTRQLEEMTGGSYRPNPDQPDSQPAVEERPTEASGALIQSLPPVQPQPSL